MRARTSASPRLRHLTPRLLAAAALIMGAVTVIGISAAHAAESAAAERAVDTDAQFFLGIAKATAADASDKVETGALRVQIAQLGDTAAMDPVTVGARTEQLRATTLRTATALTAWEREQEAAAAAAAAAAEQLALANTPDGARATARTMAAERYGWDESQFSCLSSLWQKESSWDFQAENPSSGAYGIPQSLPGDKMADAGADWRSNATTQISWGLDYIDRAYGTPCAAWGHSQATDWY